MTARCVERTAPEPRDAPAASDAREAEGGGEGLHLLLELLQVLVPLEAHLKVLEFLALLLLDGQGDLAAAVQEACDLLEVRGVAAPRGHGRRADAHAAGAQGRGVTVHRVAVQTDGRGLADL